MNTYDAIAEPDCQLADVIQPATSVENLFVAHNRMLEGGFVIDYHSPAGSSLASGQRWSGGAALKNRQSMSSAKPGYCSCSHCVP